MKRLRKNLLTSGMAFVLLVASCSKINYTGGRPENFSNAIVLEWNEVAYQVFGGKTYLHSLMASRINAMVHLAMHDALNAIHPTYETYAFKGRDAQAHPLAAAASAAHTVLISEIPDKKEFLDSTLQQSLTGIPYGHSKIRGIALGNQAGQAILDNRRNDGSAGNPVTPVAPSVVAGVYQAVPPFDFYFAPYWENVKLFGLQRKDQFRSVSQPAMTSEVYTAAFQEVKEVGRLNSSTRTADQTEFAHFWYEFSEAGWNRVARVVANERNLSLLETARLFALVDMAMADAYITGWDSKLFYNHWRPYTAIRQAEKDGNNQTSADLSWEPELPTPPIQDYPSTHSALGNAAAVVLASLLGDHTAFTMESPTAIPAGGTRSFSSFSQAARENAESRIMAGIHFRFACEAGLELGKNVGEWIVDNNLRPLREK